MTLTDFLLFYFSQDTINQLSNIQYFTYIFIFNFFIFCPMFDKKIYNYEYSFKINLINYLFYCVFTSFMQLTWFFPFYLFNFVLFGIVLPISSGVCHITKYVFNRPDSYNHQLNIFNNSYRFTYSFLTFNNCNYLFVNYKKLYDFIIIRVLYRTYALMYCFDEYPFNFNNPDRRIEGSYSLIVPTEDGYFVTPSVREWSRYWFRSYYTDKYFKKVENSDSLRKDYIKKMNSRS